jgi:hypothetical protein
MEFKLADPFQAEFMQFIHEAVERSPEITMEELIKQYFDQIV